MLTCGLKLWLLIYTVVISLSLSKMSSITSSSSLFSKSHLARISLPPPMFSNSPGSWAFSTMTERIVNDILPRIISDNEMELTSPSSPLRSECLLQLNDLRSSLLCKSSGILRGLGDSGPDHLLWEEILNSIPSESRNWVDSPWVISEFYFYRRIVEAFRYFETGYDMFAPQKLRGLLDAKMTIDDIALRLPYLLESEDISRTLEIAVHTSLWGNKMDLSLWPGSSKQSSSNKECDNSQNQAGEISYGSSLESTKSFILDDDTPEILKCLLTASHLTTGRADATSREVGIVVDNAGYELFTDLLLGHVILKLKLADTVTFHTKGHPTFVSDATNEDVIETIRFLLQSETESTKTLGEFWKSHIEDGSFKLKEDLFWCQPQPFWDMPTHIQEKISNNIAVFVKGDANFRRLLGEREWPLDFDPKIILSYWPVPVCALRTFKAEIGCGISSEAQDRAKAADPNWMVSGRWGVIQFGGNNPNIPQ